MLPVCFPSDGDNLFPKSDNLCMHKWYIVKILILSINFWVESLVLTLRPQNTLKNSSQQFKIKYSNSLSSKPTFFQNPSKWSRFSNWFYTHLQAKKHCCFNDFVKKEKWTWFIQIVLFYLRGLPSKLNCSLDTIILTTIRQYDHMSLLIESGGSQIVRCHSSVAVVKHRKELFNRII